MAPTTAPELDLAQCFKGEQQLVYVYRFELHPRMHR
jgi:hypothetical protein